MKTTEPDPSSIVFAPALQRPFILHPTQILKGWRYKHPDTGQWAMATDEASVTHARMFSSVTFEPCLLYHGHYLGSGEFFWWFVSEEALATDATLAQIVEMARQHVMLHVADNAYVRPVVMFGELPTDAPDPRNN